MAISCRPNSHALALSVAADVDPHRFRGAANAAARVKVHGAASTPFMGAVGRVHAGRAAKVLFFQNRIDAGKVLSASLPGLMRDYPELRVPQVAATEGTL